MAKPASNAGRAWYATDRASFLAADQEAIVAELSSAASSQGWHIEAQQHEEWDASVGILKAGISDGVEGEIEIVRSALAEAGLTEYAEVIFEYDFRRRGLRIDCILLAPGIVAVLEFKRSVLTAADEDQVTNYAINLVEFHEETRRQCREHGAVVIPILVQTKGRHDAAGAPAAEFYPAPWNAVLRRPIRCDRKRLGQKLLALLQLRRHSAPVSRRAWLESRFAPSSSILDAAISLFGNHEVSAIHEHAGSIEQIDAALDEALRHIAEAKKHRRNRVVFVSGAPGAGKTLVGLRLAFDSELREDAVFVTGNAPLVEVLTEALKRSYRQQTSRAAAQISGYPRESARMLIRNATFKIVKAHNFLGQRGSATASADGSVVIFDEAQRTYEKGRRVLGKKLEDHEADLILASLESSYVDGAVVVALLGHNQAINRGERGAIAWLEAAERRGWEFSVADETLGLAEFEAVDRWSAHRLRRVMSTGHLSQSLRFYRNREVEAWVHSVMEDNPGAAKFISERLEREGHQVWLTRSLAAARTWVRKQRIGDERAGIIASGQGRRLAAEGLFVDQKPSIAKWMLAPSGDIRSSNMLEAVQNQFQVQGLELDYTIVAWDVDLRRESGLWASWKISGGGWQRDKALEVLKNSYRVLLTRARKGMVIYIPTGDLSGEDKTRVPAFYDGVAQYLRSCGATELPSAS